MMRGISTWAVAVRKPSAEQLAAGGPDSKEGAKGEIEVDLRAAGLVDASAIACCGSRSSAAWSRWASRSRSASRRSASPPTRRCPPDEDGEKQEIGGGAWVGTIVFAMLFAVGLFFLLPAGLTNLFADEIPELVRVRGDREARPDLDLPRLPVADLAHARPPARVPVPRRRAQDDLLLRGRRAADARERAALLALPPALRHELPAAGDDRGHLGLRAARQARLALAVHLAHRSASRSSPASPSS